ncbi:MAG: DUF3427 domain-containing protein, partial [Peptostreptococcaceae bacterium]
IVEYYEHGEIDPMLFIDYAGTYHNFLQKIDKEYNIEFTEKEIALLEFVSKIIVNGKRPHELVILDYIMSTHSFCKQDIQRKLYQNYNIEYTDKSVESAIHVLGGKFVNSPSDKKKFAELEILQPDDSGYYQRAMSYHQRLQHREFYSDMNDLIDLGLKRYSDIYLP